MSVEYDMRLKQHIANVRKAYFWIKRSLPEILLEMRALYESDTETYEELEPYTRDAQENYDFLHEVWTLLQDKA